MRRILITMGILFILLTALLTLRFGSALYQEGNPLPVLYAITHLELADSAYEKFAEEDFSKRYVSADTGEGRYDVIKKFMDEQGWVFEEQAGSGLIFEKDGIFLAVETRQYSERYVLWDVPKQFYE